MIEDAELHDFTARRAAPSLPATGAAG
jgi:hypothetical protein